ncbi:type I secretion protein, partial [Pseudomonas fluorescens]
ILVGDWIDDPTTVLDYDVDNDQIAVLYDAADGAEIEVALSAPDSTTGTVSILINGHAVATLNGASGLTVEDIAIVAQSAP